MAVEYFTFSNEKKKQSDGTLPSICATIHASIHACVHESVCPRVRTSI